MYFNDLGHVVPDTDGNEKPWQISPLANWFPTHSRRSHVPKQIVGNAGTVS